MAQSPRVTRVFSVVDPSASAAFISVPQDDSTTQGIVQLDSNPPERVFIPAHRNVTFTIPEDRISPANQTQSRSESNNNTNAPQSSHPPKQKSPFGPHANRWLDNGTFHMKQIAQETDIEAALANVRAISATGGDESANALRHRNSLFSGSKSSQTQTRSQTEMSGVIPSPSPDPITEQPDQLSNGLHYDHETDSDPYMSSIHPNPSNYFTILHWRGALAEFICTSLFFTMLFSIIIASQKLGYNNQSTTLISCYGGGMLVAAFIYLFGSISGAYFSVSITIATMAIGKHSIRTCILYFIAQLLGSIFAMCMITMIYPDGDKYWSTLTIVPDPGVPALRIIAMEAFLAFISVYVFLNISHWHGSMGPFMTGLVTSILVFIGIPVSGGCINVARVFGPAVFANVWTRQYLYWIGTWIGAIFAGYFTMYVHNYMKLLDWARDVSIPMHDLTLTPNRFRYRIATEIHGHTFTIEHWACALIFILVFGAGIAIGGGWLDF